VDLHAVVRQGLRAGVSSYSLKEVEALARFARQADIKSGTRAVLAYETFMQTRDEAALARIAAYNAEDCRASWRCVTGCGQPADGTRWARAVAAKEREDADEGEREALRQRARRRQRPGVAVVAAGELLEYHRREARPGGGGSSRGAIA